MQLKTKGIPFSITAPIVGKITFNNDHPADILVLKDSIALPSFPYKVILSSLTQPVDIDIAQIYAIPDFHHLTEGDIVIANTDGLVASAYRVSSRHNFLLFTERCNSNCLMCSQPPRDRDDTDYLFNIHSQTIPLIPKDCTELGITGGEPTLLGPRFFSLLSLIKDNLPETEVHCLTNGRSFAWAKMAHQLGDLSFERLMLGIPLYSDHSAQHDYIVQAKDAFDQTIQGLYNLAKNDVRIELRIVLHKLTIPRLVKLSKFIYKNLPFVEHIAFMSLEHQGYTPHNFEKLWIDPIDYGEELIEAMTYLSDFNMNVSLYNAQLCTTPQKLWSFSRKSISDWKNSFHPICEKCSKKDDCGGFFASNLLRFSAGLQAIKTNSVQF